MAQAPHDSANGNDHDRSTSSGDGLDRKPHCYRQLSPSEAFEQIEKARRAGVPIVPLIGAGLSSESGIPTTDMLIDYFSKVKALIDVKRHRQRQSRHVASAAAPDDDESGHLSTPRALVTSTGRRGRAVARRRSPRCSAVPWRRRRSRGRLATRGRTQSPPRAWRTRRRLRTRRETRSVRPPRASSDRRPPLPRQECRRRRPLGRRDQRTPSATARGSSRRHGSTWRAAHGVAGA